MSEEKVYTFSEYVLGYDSGEDNDRSCLTISKILNDNMYVMSTLYDGSAEVISTILDSLQQKVEQLEKQNKILKENAEHNDKVVDKVNWENMFLKGKLKDLKERIMLKQLRLVNEETYNILHSDLNELLEVLDREIKYEQ